MICLSHEYVKWNKCRQGYRRIPRNMKAINPKIKEFLKITQFSKIEKRMNTLGALPQFRSAWFLKPICNLSFDLCFTSKNFKTVLTYSVTRLCAFQFLTTTVCSKKYVTYEKKLCSGNVLPKFQYFLGNVVAM